MTAFADIAERHLGDAAYTVLSACSGTCPHRRSREPSFLVCSCEGASRVGDYAVLQLRAELRRAEVERCKGSIFPTVVDTGDDHRVIPRGTPAIGAFAIAVVLTMQACSTSTSSETISGRLIDGTRFTISGPNAEEWVPVSAAAVVVADVPTPQPLGISHIERTDDAVAWEPRWDGRRFTVASDGWRWTLEVYEHHWAELSAGLEAWTSDVTLNVVSLHPEITLPAGFRWAAPDEVPVQMAVRYGQGVREVRRGCSLGGGDDGSVRFEQRLFVKCASDRTVELVTTRRDLEAGMTIRGD